MIILQWIQEHAGTCNTHWMAQIIIQERHWMLFPGILSWNGQMTLKVKVNYPPQPPPPFSTPAARMSRCLFGENFIIVAQINNNVIITSYFSDKTNFLEIAVKWPNWPWESGSMTLIFNTSREYHMMHVLCKFSDSYSNLWRVIAQTKKSVRTDRERGGWTNIRADIGNNNTTSVWKAKG